MSRGRYLILVRVLSCAIVLGLGGAAAPLPPAAHHRAPFGGKRLFDHILLVILENQDYADVMNDAYFKRLAANGALFSNSLAVAHPSYPNYIALVAGDTYRIPDDRLRDLDVRSLADLLEAKGLTWKNYAQGYPGHCSLVSRSDRYDRKHVPFINFTSIQAKPERCANIVDALQFDLDKANGHLPSYAFLSPDRDNDGHDTSLAYASSWLQTFLEPLLMDPAFMKGTLIIVTFDESRDQAGRNHIYTMFLGPMVKAGYVEARAINHYTVLRTIEENFALGTLGKKDAQNDPIAAVWK